MRRYLRLMKTGSDIAILYKAEALSPASVMVVPLIAPDAARIGGLYVVSRWGHGRAGLAATAPQHHGFTRFTSCCHMPSYTSVKNLCCSMAYIMCRAGAFGGSTRTHIAGCSFCVIFLVPNNLGPGLRTSTDFGMVRRVRAAAWHATPCRCIGGG